MTELEKNPTPLSTTCPVCHEEDSLLVAVDSTEYYPVTEIDEGHVKGTSTVAALLKRTIDRVDIRLFCCSCGEYFEMPDSYELSG